MLSTLTGAVRGFSTESKVIKHLKAERVFEQENYSPVKDKVSVLEKTGYSLTESDTSKLMVMTKQSGDYEINIFFEARTPAPAENYQPEQGEQPDEEQDQEMEDFVDFTVSVSKPGAAKGLVIDCACFNSELSINYVTAVEQPEKYARESRLSRAPDQYLGPEFGTLEERVQVAMQDFLQGLGLDDEVVTFIEIYSLDKEQRLYMNWLDDVEAFLSH